jgi:hypothetical protein
MMYGSSFSRGYLYFYAYLVGNSRKIEIILIQLSTSQSLQQELDPRRSK